MEKTSFSVQLVTFLSGFNGPMAYTVILGVLFACGLGVPIPEDITLLAAGILAALDKISLWGAIIAGLVGVMVGDSFLFFLGRRLGKDAFKLPLIRNIMKEKTIAMAEAKLIENSKFVCFTARFLPGLRSPVFLMSGIMGIRPSTFFALDGLAAAISVPFWVVVGFYFGKNIDTAIQKAKELQIYIFIFIGVFILLYVLYKWFKNSKISQKS